MMGPGRFKGNWAQEDLKGSGPRKIYGYLGQRLHSASHVSPGKHSILNFTNECRLNLKTV